MNHVVTGRGIAIANVVHRFNDIERDGGKEGIANSLLLRLRMAPGDSDSCLGGDHGIVKHQDIARHIVVRLIPDRRSAVVNEHVVVEDDIAFALKQGFSGWVLIKEVTGYQVLIVGTGPIQRKVPYQQVWPRIGPDGSVACLSRVARRRRCTKTRSSPK